MDKILNNVLSDLESLQLNKALKTLRTYLEEHPEMRNDGGIDDVERDYRLMLDYMGRGYADDNREHLYRGLLERTYRFMMNLYVSYKIRTSQLFAEASRSASAHDFGQDEVKRTLEGFVTDFALLSLETESVKKEKTTQLYKVHDAYLSALFCHLLVSRQWNVSDREFYSELMLSPTIDVNDIQLIVSALTLSNLSFFDIHKFSALVHVYLTSTHERVRQRALVGWVLSMGREGELFPAYRQCVHDVCQDEKVSREIADMQKQMIFCKKAEEDKDRIQQDILPTLMNNNNLFVSRSGIITEKEEDGMEDILNPDADDRKMEEMEESFNQMVNMQKAGSDIYFGGFSQMKRFPFFYSVSNWFCPFYLEHSGIVSVVDRMRGSDFLKNVLEHGPFCDSDKYSFILAMASVIEKLPANLREMLGNADALGPVASEAERHDGTYIRRMYLQDLYRFFRLYTYRVDMKDPFGTPHYLFATSPAFEHTAVENHFADLCMFMRKQKDDKAFGLLVKRFDNQENPKSMLMGGIYYLDVAHDQDRAVGCLGRLLELEPDNERALSLLARAHFERGDFEEALENYRSLYGKHPENKHYALPYGVALSSTGHYEEAVTLFYKLSYENPTSVNVMRGLAWALMGGRKLQQAEAEYARLLAAGKNNTGDYLNAGYCQWLLGNTGKAIDMFRKFKELVGTESIAGKLIEDEFANDAEWLHTHGISRVDIQLMSDLLENPS
ncbi:MAG: tetratricopeptide repeat protein [Prevotellaceae bacterium]|nr:tetratricopeptide repeat protein [Prevotellaceae bacterium]MDY6131364.1 tetratricopeptide repeat protein [Prevotella sp.]